MIIDVLILGKLMEKLYLRLFSNSYNGPTKVAKFLFAAFLICFSFSGFAQIAPITGPTGTCIGDCTNLTDATPGGTWSSSNTGVATIDATGQICGVSTGSVTITYSVSPNIAIYTFTVFPALPPIVGVHNMCAWFDSMFVTDANTTGVFSSTGATTRNIFGPGFSTTGTAWIKAQAPGLDYIKYSVPSGCYVLDSFTVFPIPTPITGNDTLCLGDMTSLSSTPAGYTWSSSNPLVASIVPPATSMPGVVSGVAAGTAIVTYMNPVTGCKVDTTITVLNPPAPIFGDSMMCNGHCVTFTDATAGGVWSSSNTSVLAVSSTTSTTATICAVGLGTAIITYTATTGRTSCIQTYSVTVNPDPGPILGPTHVCVGATITLSDGTPAGTWSSSAIFSGIATVDPSTGVVTGVGYGNAVITYMLPTGCYTTTIISVDTAPAPIVGPKSFCCGSSPVHYTDPTPGGVWSPSTPTTCIFIDIVGYATCVAGATPPCTQIITYTLPTGCYTTDTITAYQPPTPIVGVHTLCVGDSSLFSVTPAGGTWSSNSTGVASVDSSSGMVHGIASGFATISYTLGTGCFATFDVTVLAVPTLTGAGTDTLCRGDSVNFTTWVTPGGGTWTTTSTLVDSLGATPGEVYAIGSGVGIVTYSIGTGSCAVPIDVYVNPSDPIIGPDSFCKYDNFNFYDADTAAGSYTWTSFPTGIVTISSTGLVSGVAAGTTIITFTNFFGCVRTHPLTIKPNSLIYGPLSICYGDTALIIDSIPGGTWSTSFPSVGTITSTTTTSGYSTATISTGPGITSSPSGTTIISYLNPYGCSHDFFLNVVPSPPPPSPSPDSICVGDSTVLIDSGPYPGVWSSGSTSIATIDSADGVFGGVSAGTAIITFSYASGCFALDTIKVNPRAPITGIDTVCVGATTTLSDIVPGGSWSVNPTSVATIDTAGVVYGVSPGTAVVTYTTLGGCSNYDTITVDPIPTLVPDTATFCQYSTIMLISTPGPTAGTWTSSNTSVATVDTAGDVGGVAAGTAIITFALPTGGCIATSTVNINPSPHVSGNPDICITFTGTLTATPGGGKWSSTDTAVATIDSVTGVITSVSPGTTLVSYILPTGCDTVVIVTIHNPPVVTVTASDTLMICRGATDTLTGHLNVPEAVINPYIWSPGYAISSTAGNPVYVSPTVTTTYTVVGTDFWGCRDTTSYTVGVDTELNHLSVLGRDSICAGTCDTLIGLGRLGSHFNWHPASGLSCTICDTVVACPDATTNYIGVVIDNFGCRDSVQKKVTVMPIPVFTITPWPVVVCRGTPLPIYAFGAYYYIWTPNFGLSCDTCANPVITDTSNMVYQLTGISKFGCMDSINVPVSVLDTNLDIFSKDTIICEGGSANLFAISHSVHGNLDIPSYAWTPGATLNDSTSSLTVATPTVTTVYTVVVTENACFKDTATIKVTVDPLPNLIIKNNPNPANHSLVAGSLDTMIVEVTNDVISRFIWTPSTYLSCDTCDTTVATVLNHNQKYIVEVISNHNCIAYDTITFDVFCDQSQVFVPNTFTPNGDGVNDRFYVSAKGLTTIKNFMIYNRWGQTVYEAHNIQPNDASVGWDGTYKGYVLEPDVFVVIVDAVCELNGQPFHYQTNVSIVR